MRTFLLASACVAWNPLATSDPSVPVQFLVGTMACNWYPAARREQHHPGMLGNPHRSRIGVDRIQTIGVWLTGIPASHCSCVPSQPAARRISCQTWFPDFSVPITRYAIFMRPPSRQVCGRGCCASWTSLRCSSPSVSHHLTNACRYFQVVFGDALCSARESNSSMSPAFAITRTASDRGSSIPPSQQWSAMFLCDPAINSVQPTFSFDAST